MLDQWIRDQVTRLNFPWLLLAYVAVAYAYAGAVYYVCSKGGCD